MKLVPVYSDKRCTYTVREDEGGRPYVQFRGGPLRPISGQTKFADGTKIRVFFDWNQRNHDGWWLLGPDGGKHEHWNWV